MEEKPRKCKWCKWFNPSQSWNPREGECKKPAGDVKMQTDEFKAGRYPGKLILDQNEAKKCADLPRLQVRKSRNTCKFKPKIAPGH